MHPKQRSWDALLILHWRRDNRMSALAVQCRDMLGAYPHELAEEGLIRCSAFYKPTMHVRVWIDTWLHPLSVKLWDIEDNLRVLNWLNASTGLDCETSKKARRWQQEGYSKNKLSTLHMQQVKMSQEYLYGGARRMDNPNQVKSKGKVRK